MKFATLPNATPDGRLIVVSTDLARAVDATAIAPSLLHAVQHWAEVEAPLRDLYARLNAGLAAESFAFEPAQCAAPLPRSPQWLDGSAFLNHGRLMERAFNTAPIPDFDTIPVMYQGASDDFLGPYEDVPLPAEADGIDFEGEFGVVVDAVPMAATPAQALARVRLLVQINDWSLRALGSREMKTGFGFLQAKPSTSFAPVAVTPDELGDAWREARIHLPLHVERNGERFGDAHGGEMNFGCDELIAHAARSRRIAAGAIIGSGTVSNAARSVGSSCIAERRVIEILDRGEAMTSFMHFGERACMQAVAADGSTPFGAIDQRVVPARPGQV